MDLIQMIRDLDFLNKRFMCSILSSSWWKKNSV